MTAVLATPTAEAPARPENAEQRAIRRAREHFAAETGEHQMTVLLDRTTEGEVYRHLRFARPGTGMWRFDLVTWPGHLAISGDLESFTFSRIPDMFDFFRGGRVNPGYWAEKVVSGKAKVDFVEEAYVAEVTQHLEWQRPEKWDTPEAHARFEALSKAVHDNLLGEDGYTGLPLCAEEAHERVAEFEWTSGDGEHSFEFTDTWEWDFSGFDHHYLVAIHAIQHGVNTYLATYPDRLQREVTR